MYRDIVTSNQNYWWTTNPLSNCNILAMKPLRKVSKFFSAPVNGGILHKLTVIPKWIY